MLISGSVGALVGWWEIPVTWCDTMAPLSSGHHWSHQHPVSTVSVDTNWSVPDQKIFCCLSSLHNSAESDQNITTISCYFQSNGTISNQSFSTLPTLFTCGWILLYIGNMDSHKPTKHIHHRVKGPHGIVNPPLIEQDFLSHRRFRKIWVSAIPSFNWFCMMGGNFNEEKRVLLTC